MASRCTTRSSGWIRAVDVEDKFTPLEEAIAALGVTIWPMIEVEADDALAAAAAAADRDTRVEQVIICTPDKDLGQCVRGDRVVLEVGDTGVGIEGRNRGKVLQESFSTKKGHYGMGLTLVRDLIEKCGGEIAYLALIEPTMLPPALEVRQKIVDALEIIGPYFNSFAVVLLGENARINQPILEGLMLRRERGQQHHLVEPGRLHRSELLDDLGAAADEARRPDPFGRDELALLGLQPHAVTNVDAPVALRFGRGLHEGAGERARLGEREL